MKLPKNFVEGMVERRTLTLDDFEDKPSEEPLVDLLAYALYERKRRLASDGPPLADVRRYKEDASLRLSQHAVHHLRLQADAIRKDAIQATLAAVKPPGFATVFLATFLAILLCGELAFAIWLNWDNIGAWAYRTFGN